MILRPFAIVVANAALFALALFGAPNAARAGPVETPPAFAASKSFAPADAALDKALEVLRAENAGLDACLCAARKAALRTRAEELKRERERERNLEPSPTESAD